MPMNCYLEAHIKLVRTARRYLHELPLSWWDKEWDTLVDLYAREVRQ